MAKLNSTAGMMMTSDAEGELAHASGLIHAASVCRWYGKSGQSMKSPLVAATESSLKPTSPSIWEENPTSAGSNSRWPSWWCRRRALIRCHAVDTSRRPRAADCHLICMGGCCQQGPRPMETPTPTQRRRVEPNRLSLARISALPRPARVRSQPTNCCN